MIESQKKQMKRQSYNHYIFHVFKLFLNDTQLSFVPTIFSFVAAIYMQTLLLFESLCLVSTTNPADFHKQNKKNCFLNLIFFNPTTSF